MHLLKQYFFTLVIQDLFTIFFKRSNFKDSMLPVIMCSSETRRMVLFLNCQKKCAATNNKQINSNKQKLNIFVNLIHEVIMTALVIMLVN